MTDLMTSRLNQANDTFSCTRQQLTMFNTLAVNIDGAIGRLELNQPDKLNPLSGLALSELARRPGGSISRPALRSWWSAERGGRFLRAPTSALFRGNRRMVSERPLFKED